MDEMARYDIPAIVQYVTEYTQSPKIGFVGFSQGTAQGFAALSTQTRTAARVNGFAALGPAVTVKGYVGPVWSVQGGGVSLKCGS